MIKTLAGMCLVAILGTSIWVNIMPKDYYQNQLMCLIWGYAVGDFFARNFARYEH